MFKFAEPQDAIEGIADADHGCPYYLSSQANYVGTHNFVSKFAWRTDSSRNTPR
jgi:hypothetical protein